MRLKYVWSLCLIALLLAACGRPKPTVEPTVDVSPTAVQEGTRAATPTPTVAFTATARPTATPIPTFTATSAPTHTPEPTPTATTAAKSRTTLRTVTLGSEQAPNEIPLDLVGQIGGYSRAVAVEQGLVYLGLGPRLIVLDEHSAATDPRTVGQSEVLPGVIQGLYLADDLAYVAVGEAGLVILDVKEPSAISSLSVLATPSTALSVFVEPVDGAAYIVGGEGFWPDQSGWLSIVDVSLPEQPELLSSVELPGPAYNVAVVGSYAYIAYADGLLVMDVTDPLAPVEAANVEVSEYTRDLAVIEGYVYLAGQGLTVFDLSDPAQPRQVGHFESRFPADAVAVRGQSAYLSETFCEMGYCGSTVYVVDLSSPDSPQAAGSWFSNSAVEDMYVSEDKLYLATWQKGLQVVDVSDPATLELRAEFSTLAGVEDVVVSDGFGYVSDGAQSGLRVLDLGDPANVRVRGTAESAQWAGGYAVVDGTAYVPGWVHGFRIFDVRDPDAPREVAAIELEQADQTVVEGTRAYVTMGYEGLGVLDVADPAAPQVLGGLQLDGLSNGLAAAGDRAYVTVDDGEKSALHIIDVAKPSQPGEIGWVALKGRGSNVELDPTARYAYVAVVNCLYHQCSGGLQVVDVRDPRLPQTVAWVEVPGGVFDVAVTGDHAFVAAGDGGVWVLDVSDPQHPRAVGWRDTAGRARSIVLDGGRVHIADGQGGLLVLQASWSGLPSLTEARIVSFSALPTEAEPGDVVTLSWNARGDQATICPSARYSLFTQDDCWPVSPSGTMTFTIPLEMGGNRMISLNLTVDAQESTDSATAQTSVALKCDTTWFFSDERPAGICPLKAIVSQAAAQRFERGTMIWVEQVGRYVVLQETLLDDGGPWRRVAYAQDPLDVEKDTSADVLAPSGLYAPALGFGFVWRGDAAGSPGYQEALGWALAPEFRYETVWQCDDAPPSGGRSWRTCAVRGPEGEAVLLDPLDRWKLWGEQ